MKQGAAATTAASGLLYKPDAAAARQALKKWWQGTGFALHVTAPKRIPAEQILPLPPPETLVIQWLDPLWRAHQQQQEMACTFFGGVALPLFKSSIGPGSLGLLLGAEAHLAPETVWYRPTITEPESAPPLRFTTEGNLWWTRHLALLNEGIARNEGRYLISCPDLIENLDTLAQLREGQALLMDLIERPDWVLGKVEEIDNAWEEAYNALYPLLRDSEGGTAFHAFRLWGPGKTAKVQCDFSCMISPRMFKKFVVPSLTRQCAFLDYALYHLDGTQALPQLDNLLAIDGIKAIEWTPQAGAPQGGAPQWYDLYRRIKAAGKSVQAIEVRPEEVLPLMDAVGPEGLFIMTTCDSEEQAQMLLEATGWNADDTT